LTACRRPVGEFPYVTAAFIHILIRRHHVLGMRGIPEIMLTQQYCDPFLLCPRDQLVYDLLIHEEFYIRDIDFGVVNCMAEEGLVLRSGFCAVAALAVCAVSVDYRIFTHIPCNMLDKDK